MDNNEEDIKKNLFIKIEKIFYNYIQFFAGKQLNKLNICCRDDERIFLTKLEPIIRQQYPTILCKYLYIVIIYLYYALILNEQSEDYLNEHILFNICNSLNISKAVYKDIIHLIYEVAGSDLKYAIETRQYLFLKN